MSLQITAPTIQARLRAVVPGGKGYGISHQWEGTVLTVTSDSGSSSADLMGPVGPAGDFHQLTEAEKLVFLEEAKEYIGPHLFVAELRWENDGYTPDKSFGELSEAISAGKTVVCDLIGADSRTRCTLGTYTDYSAVFVLHSPLGADEYFVITAEGVTHILPEEDEEELPSRVAVVKSDAAVTVTAAYALTDEVTTIALDDNGDPVSVTKDGTTITLEWSGFDES